MANRDELPWELRRVERWRDLPGYGGRYQVSTEGRVRQVLDGKVSPVNPVRDRKRSYRLLLTGPDGKRHQTRLLRAVALTWYPGQAEGRIVVHKNGMHSDNSAHNVAFKSNRQAGHSYGTDARRRVVEQWKDGELIDCFGSITACTRATGYCRATITKRCRAKKPVPCRDGSIFRWGDDWRRGDGKE